MIGLTKSLGKELATTGVLVNCVAPAVVKTELFSQMTEQHIQYMLSKIPMNRFGEVDEVAEMVAWLASDLCTFATGATFDLSGGRATYLTSRPHLRDAPTSRCSQGEVVVLSAI